MNLLSMLAQTNPAATNQVEPPFWASPFFIIVIIALFFYLFVVRGKRTQERQRTDMLSSLKKGDRIQTIGGILGTVIEAREQEVLVKVDETSNVKMRFSRNAIHRVIPDEGEVNK